MPEVQHVTYAWMASLLDHREQMLTAWKAVPFPPEFWETTYAGDIRDIWADLESANQSWGFTANAITTNPRDAYNANRGDYDTANKSYISRANQFGFGWCASARPSVGAW